MFESLSVFPFSFWGVVLLLVGGAVRAWGWMRAGHGLPVLAVLVTVATWYIGDALYNNYAGYHVQMFESGVLQYAWWQVAWFLGVFLLATPFVHSWINSGQGHRASGVFQMFKHGANQPSFQKQLNLLFVGCVMVWLTLTLIAAIRVQGRIIYFLFPFLGETAEPWGRGRIGSGFDALWTVAFYFQMLVTSIFGVVAALAANPRIRSLALVCCLFSMPYFIFQRARNIMLAAVIPGVLSWVFLRLRGGMLKKGAVLCGCFLIVNAWMGFVIANRSTNSITAALRDKGFSLSGGSKVHHEGLNMFEELCWVNTFMDKGTYRPNWGSRYFAEAVNVIPRSLWPGKPLIGIDYSIARGGGGGTAEQAGINTSVSTGLIGQGVVNFGRWMGPFAAALLMSLWVAVLARFDLQIQKLGRLPLYFCGLILTFNLGRDITLITLYPFVFGYLAVRWLDRPHRSPSGPALQSRTREKTVPAFRIPLRFAKQRGHIPAASMKAAPKKARFPYALGPSRNRL